VWPWVSPAAAPSSSLPEQHEGRRHPNIYTPLALYDPALLDKKWKELEGKYGKERTDRGRSFASLVYKDCDAGAVEMFILLEEKYGGDKMDEAAKIISLKAPANPWRSVGYFVRTVEALKWSPADRSRRLQKSPSVQ
jgi:hypothetical protein